MTPEVRRSSQTGLPSTGLYFLVAAGLAKKECDGSVPSGLRRPRPSSAGDAQRNRGPRATPAGPPCPAPTTAASGARDTSRGAAAASAVEIPPPEFGEHAEGLGPVQCTEVWKRTAASPSEPPPRPVHHTALPPSDRPEARALWAARPP